MPQSLSRPVVVLLFVLLLSAPLIGNPYKVFPEDVQSKNPKNSLGMEFVLIPAGEFVMGSPPGEPHRNQNEIQHRVKITKPFYMQTTEVTEKQWIALMGKRMFGQREEGVLPVVRVSWYDCMEFIEKLNARKEGLYRLPTEAEWEYACRAGSPTTFPWGVTINCSDAMYANNTLRSDECVDYVKAHGLIVNSPAPARSYAPNAWNLSNMSGNVWEWCSDWFGSYPHRPVTDPTGPPSGDQRVRRGGSWFGEGWLCRCGNRNFANPGVRYQTLGFRLVREVP